MEISSQLAEQYAAITQGAGLVPLADRTQIQVSGADGATFLHNLCTNDVRKLRPGQGCEAFVTSVQGKILGHVLVFCQEQLFVVESVAGQAERLLQHLDRYLIREDVQLVDQSASHSELLLAGGQAATCLANLVPGTLPEVPLAHETTEIAGVQASVRRVEFIRPAAFLIGARRSDADTIQAALLDRGAALCGMEVLEIARVEAGFPWFGKDITEENLPQEVCRDQRAISFTKGCYLGQETVARVDALGHVNRLLRGVRFAGEQRPQPGAELRAGDKVVGRLTSVVYSPQLAAPLAMAYIRRGHHEFGNQLTWEHGNATVIEFPV